MRITKIFLLLLLLTLPPVSHSLLAATPGRYGDSMPSGSENFDFTPSDPSARPERKVLGLFHRAPRAASSAEQYRVAMAAEKAGELSAAIKACDALVRKWPDAAEAPAAQRGMARLLERRRKYARAFDEYRYLLYYYASNLPAAESLEQMFAIANHYRAKKSRERALKMYEQLSALAPNWSHAAAVRLQVGLLQQEDGEHVAAASTFERLVGDYPTSSEAGEAAALGALCRVRLARRYRNDESYNSRALAALTTALRNYPEKAAEWKLSEESDSLLEGRYQRQFEIAAFYDTPRQPPLAAITAYKEFLRLYPEAPQAEQARTRLNQLENPDINPSSQTKQGAGTQ